MDGEHGWVNVEQTTALDVLSLLSGKWDSIVVLTLQANGPLGFNEILEAISEISGKVLSGTLESLTEADLVERRVVSDSPLRVEYELAPAGEDLGSVFEAMSLWGDRHLAVPRPTVLVAGADRRLNEMYAQWLSDRYTVERATDAEAVAERLDESVDVVLAADDLPGSDLETLFERCRWERRSILLADDRPEDDADDRPFDTVLRTPVVRTTILEAVDEQLTRGGEATP